jgi:hypothetical protein
MREGGIVTSSPVMQFLYQVAVVVIIVITIIIIASLAVVTVLYLQPSLC